MTFYELFTKVAKLEEMRVYEPNRDCLIWETFLPEHAPFKLKRNLDGTVSWDWGYANNNYYNCSPKRSRFHELDKQTKLFLEKYGDYEVHGIEASQCAIGFDKDTKTPEYCDCLDVFIVVPDPEHTRTCDRCFHSNFNQRYKRIPDPQDPACKGCPHNKEK